MSNVAFTSKLLDTICIPVTRLTLGEDRDNKDIKQGGTAEIRP